MATKTAKKSAAPGDGNKATAQKRVAKKAPTRKSAGKPGAGKSSPAKSPQSKSPPAKSSGSGKASAKKTSARKPASEDKYTDPDLRERLKQEVIAGDKGGRPGQWSARKAQLLAHEYTAEGGGYKHPRDENQQHLKDWTEEKWHTADGEPAIQGEETHRYLPDEAWAKLTPAQKKATDQKKVAGSRKGTQFVPNTAEASQARKKSKKSKK